MQRRPAPARERTHDARARTGSDDRRRTTLSTSLPSTAARRAPARLYHDSPPTSSAARDQVVVGLAASKEDEVEDWTSDFLATERPRTRCRRRESGHVASIRSTRPSWSRGKSISPPTRRASSAGVSDDDDTLTKPFVELPDDASASDEDWDVEFGFEQATDRSSLTAADNMDTTRRRAKNRNVFLPHLHKVLDGETLPDDDEPDAAWSLDGRPRRLSEEPIFQARKRTDKDELEYALADKLRLLDVATSSAYAVRIERYPKPSSTYSNLERDRATFPSFSEHQYERWLTELVRAECAVVKQHLEAERERLPPPRQMKSQQCHALVSLPFGRDFVTLFFKQMTQYRYDGDDKENRDLVRMFFEKVSTTTFTDEHWAQHLSPTDLDFVVSASMDILQEAARLYGPKPVLPLATHLSLSMLSTSSSASSSQGHKTTLYWIEQFQDILTHCAEAFPHYSNVVALIELRYVCHHLAGFASGEYEYKWQICNQLPAFLPFEPVVGDSASQIVNEVLHYYGALFQHLNTSPESRSQRYMGPPSSHETRQARTRDSALSSDVLCLQALILCDIQSLYDSKSALAERSLPALEELLEFEDDEATVDPTLVGLVPPTRDSRSSSSSSTPEYRDSSYDRGDLSKGLGGWSACTKIFQLLRPSSRTRNSALCFFYERIGASKFPLVKAKCALVLASMHVSSQGNSRLAESLAYEALRLLEARSKHHVAQLKDMLSLRRRSSSSSMAFLSLFHNDGLLSDLGRETLESLGNILIKNDKYRYGILCLEAATALYSFLNQGAEYEKLDRWLCKVTLEADDVHRALPLHEKVTCAAQRQSNITVYVYLTQEMTKLWIREGNFTRAEDYLATSCHFLRDHTNLLPPHFLASSITASYSSSEGPSSRSGTMMTTTCSSVSSSLSGSFHLSSRSGNASEVDTWLNHDINLHLLLRDVYRASGRYLEGMRVLEHVLNYSVRFPRGKRTHLRMLLAEDALKMRMLDTCRLMVSLMEREATAFCDRLQENIKGFSGPGSSSGTGPGTNSSSGTRSLGGMGSEARYCFDMSFTLRYLVCRVKLALQGKDFVHAYAWLSLAHVKNDRDNVRKQAQLHVLDGKVLRALWEEASDTSRRRPAPSVDGALKPLGVSLYGLNQAEKERLHARMRALTTYVENVDKAKDQVETAYWTAFDLYRLLDDSLYQLKVLLEIVAFVLAPIERAFFALGSCMDDELLQQQSQGARGTPTVVTGDDTMEKTRKTLLETQKLLRLALKLAEQVASPVCFLETLVSCAQVWLWLERLASYKTEHQLKEAAAFWDEAVRIHKGIFFRRVAFQADKTRLDATSSGFGHEPRHASGRFCVVPILNFNEGFIRKLEAKTLQLIFAACQLTQFERRPSSLDDLVLNHLDELLSARFCLSSIVHQLETFRAQHRAHKHVPPVLAGAKPTGSVSSVGSNNSRSSSFSAVLSGVSSPQVGANATTPSPRAAVAHPKRGHKKNQSMSSISELLASTSLSPYQEGPVPYPELQSSATPRTGLASLRERPTLAPSSSLAVKGPKSDHKARQYTRERSLSAPQPLARSPNAVVSSMAHCPTERERLDAKLDPAPSMKRTSSAKFIDLRDVGALFSPNEYVGNDDDDDGFGKAGGSSIGLCDFDDTQSEKLWWIFNLWRDAKTKYVDGKIETSELRARNLRYLRTLVDAFDPQQIAVLSYDGRASDGQPRGPAPGMLDFDVSRMKSHALIQEGPFVLSLGYEDVDATSGRPARLAFKVFRVQEGETHVWRDELPRPEWYLTTWDHMEMEDHALVLLRVFGANWLLKLVGLLLLEASVVLVGTSYLQLYDVSTSLLKLLTPFRWQHTFVPFVPVTSWRFLHDIASHHAQTELMARPKSRRSLTRLSHEWRAWASAGSTASSSRDLHTLRARGKDEEPPFLVGTTAATWHQCLAHVKQRGHDPRVLASCVVVVDLDDVDALATDKTLRAAVPLPKKWRRQFVDRLDKLMRQRHKVRVKASRRGEASRTPSASMRSPEHAGMETTTLADGLSSSRSGSSWICTPRSGVSESEPSVKPVGGDGKDRLVYDLEGASVFVSGLRDFYDKLVVLCRERARKAKKKHRSSSSTGHSKRHELKAWFTSSHDFDAFVEQLETTQGVARLDDEAMAARKSDDASLSRVRSRIR
ncbi:hypothetical protein PsorP6_011274 [Peronosclerospora sorghi]|uniref:Uncharacterized protein n=1 Tax=Peronosclerospora sorghi TaxID=230839 RepID=A0ACC0WLH1_9STRA|nr:hypothetical protein PsorP6_011274 [Peronosclerospora sorghi]